MGFMDKVKSAAKNVDEKLGNAVDCSKLDSKISDEEKKIKDQTNQAGQKVVSLLKDGKEFSSADFQDVLAAIKESEAKIEELKAEKDKIKIKECDSKIEKLDNQKEEVVSQKEELEGKKPEE